MLLLQVHDQVPAQVRACGRRHGRGEEPEAEGRGRREDQDRLLRGGRLRKKFVGIGTFFWIQSVCAINQFDIRSRLMIKRDFSCCQKHSIALQDPWHILV